MGLLSLYTPNVSQSLLQHLLFSIESDEILQQMVAKLTACVPAEQAKHFAKSLDLNGNDLPDSPHIQLSELCDVWIAKKHRECTPEGLVEALVCTEGLGKYASGIGGNFLLALFIMY